VAIRAIHHGEHLAGFQSRDQFAVCQILFQDSIGLLLGSAGEEQFIVMVVEVLVQFLYDLCLAGRRKIQCSDCALDLFRPVMHSQPP
jgi:hypothetical protein